MKFLLLVALSTGFAFAQTSIYTEFGPIGAANYLGGFGINMPVTVNQSIFIESSLESRPVVPSFLIGFKTNIASFIVKKHVVTPFLAVAYGASIKNLAEIKASVLTSSSLTGVVTAIGSTPGFTQRYGVGFEVKFSHVSVGIGGQTQSNSGSSGWYAYPFVYVAHTF